MSAVARPVRAVVARRLALAPGVRFFSWNGRTQAHVSSVPLPYVSLGDSLARALSSFEGGRTVDAVADEAGLPLGEPRAAFARFFDALDRAGVVQDPERPDPIHRLRPDDRRGASLYLFPTNRCNLGCVYCYASSGPAGGPRSPRTTRRSPSTASSAISLRGSRRSR